MKEDSWWETILKPRLHAPAHGRVAWKVGTSTRAGIPDVVWSIGDPNLAGRAQPRTSATPWRRSGWLELKYLDGWPVRQTTPIRPGTSLAQHGHLQEWAQGGGAAWVLLGMPDPETGEPGALAYFLEPGHPEAIQREDLPHPLRVREASPSEFYSLAGAVPKL